MAQHAHPIAPSTTPDPKRGNARRGAPGGGRRPVQTSRSGRSPKNTATDRQAGSRGIPRRVVGLAAAGVIPFLLAISFFLSGNLGHDLAKLGVIGFAVIFFTLTLGLTSRVSREPRWGGPNPESLEMFSKEKNVAIHTGTISGREALTQILLLPATLAVGMWAISLVFAFSR